MASQKNNFTISNSDVLGVTVEAFKKAFADHIHHTLARDEHTVTEHEKFVGLFAVAEVLYAALYEGKVDQSQNKVTRVHMTRRDWKRSVPAWLRGTIIG